MLTKNTKQINAILSIKETSNFIWTCYSTLLANLQQQKHHYSFTITSICTGVLSVDIADHVNISDIQ